MRPGRRCLAVGVLALGLAVLLAGAPDRRYFLRNTDHGFQLGLGSQVLFGKTPGVDALNHYGPAVPYVSALAQWATGSLAGEVLVCALGYALALLLIHVLVARATRAWMGCAAAAVAFLLLPRFYKWYVWLLPLCVLWAVDRWLDAPREERGRAAFRVGLAAGVTGLFRPDLGSTCALAACALVALVAPDTGIGPPEVPGRARRAARSALPVAAGSCVAPGAWLLFLALREGPVACGYFLRSTLGGALGTSTGMSTSFPALDPADLLSPRSALVIAYVVLLAVYAAGLLLGLCAELRGRGTARTRLLLASAVVGLATVHQALHRRDVQHLLQVLPPALIATCALLHGIGRSRAGRLAAGALLVAAWGAVVPGLAQRSRIDLAELDPWPARRFAELADPRGPRIAGRLAAVDRRVRELTAPDDAILVFPLEPQRYFFAGRRASGKLVAYYKGVFSDPPWSEENRAGIAADPPAVVVVPSGFLGPLAEDDPLFEHRTAHADLERFLRRHYTRTLYDDGRTAILGRARR